jgi:hypothetical protein
MQYVKTDEGTAEDVEVFGANRHVFRLSDDDLMTLHTAMQMMRHAVETLPVVVGASDAQDRIDARNKVSELFVCIDVSAKILHLPTIDVTQGGF